MSDEPIHPTDDEVLAEAVEVRLENESEALAAALIEADRAIAASEPDLIAKLDAHAAAYGDDTATWYADMQCGDLPPDDRARDRIIELRTRARNEMYTIVLGIEMMGSSADALKAAEDDSPSTASDGILFPELSVERRALWEAATAIHRWLAELDEDNAGWHGERIAGTLGDCGPRYILGF
jgi:hypothetical protein